MCHRQFVRETSAEMDSRKDLVTADRTAKFTKNTDVSKTFLNICAKDFLRKCILKIEEHLLFRTAKFFLATVHGNIKKIQSNRQFCNLSSQSTIFVQDGRRFVQLASLGQDRYTSCFFSEID